MTMLRAQGQALRLNCLGANSDLKSLNTMSKLQKAKSTNTYLMAASSDAPHGPFLFPNSAKIFGISWDMHGFESSNLSSNPRVGRNVVVLQHAGTLEDVSHVSTSLALRREQASALPQLFTYGHSSNTRGRFAVVKQ